MIPEHYRQASASIEPRQFLQLMPFLMATGFKYLLRFPYKGQAESDLQKALDYFKWSEDEGEEIPLENEVLILFLEKAFFGENRFFEYSETGVFQLSYEAVHQFIDKKQKALV